MKQLLPAVLVLLTIVSLTTNSFAKEGQIYFKKGQSATTIKGRWDSYNDTYVFNARKGQRLKLDLISSRGKQGSLFFNIYAYCGGEEYGTPISSNVTSWSGILPCTDRYSIDIRTSKEITKDLKLGENYLLKMSIK